MIGCWTTPSRATAGQLLVEEDGTFRFRHELVREALRRQRDAGRAALLHRQAGRVLAQRPTADPVTVADHARRAATSSSPPGRYGTPPARAAERFDHAAAEALLDDALLLHAEPEGWLARARVRTRRARYLEALDDVERAAAAGPAALEVGAWACLLRPPLRAGGPVRRGRRAGCGGPRPTTAAAWPRPAASTTPPGTWPRRSCC